MKYGQEELKFIVERIDKNLYELTDWEKTFFHDIAPLVRNNKPLSPKQAECLSRIWDKISEV